MPGGPTMKLIILENYSQASEWAAKYIRNRIVQFGPGPGRFFTLGLPTGGCRGPGPGPGAGPSSGRAPAEAAAPRRQHPLGLLQQAGGVLPQRRPLLQVREDLQHGRVRG